MSKLRQYGYIPGLIICVGLTAFYSWNWYMEARLYQAVRVHFVANSDHPRDQRLKLQVRDQVLKTVTPGVETADSRQAAVAYLQSNLPQIKRAASQEIRARGYNYPVQVALGEREYGWRNNGGIIFPRGHYTSLTVTIGQAQGHNWWGVIYPPFGLVGSENHHGKTEYRCKLWDMVNQR